VCQFPIYYIWYKHDWFYKFYERRKCGSKCVHFDFCTSIKWNTCMFIVFSLMFLFKHACFLINTERSNSFVAILRSSLSNAFSWELVYYPPLCFNSSWYRKLTSTSIQYLYLVIQVINSRVFSCAWRQPWSIVYFFV
jgi:ABC-type bacteriocin/lantibiotic exporter with double-glycine peptidase domain